MKSALFICRGCLFAVSLFVLFHAQPAAAACTPSGTVQQEERLTTICDGANWVNAMYLNSEGAPSASFGPGAAPGVPQGKAVTAVGYIQLEHATADPVPPSADCDAAAEMGRTIQANVAGSLYVYVCFGAAGWRYMAPSPTN